MCTHIQTQKSIEFGKSLKMTPYCIKKCLLVSNMKYFVLNLMSKAKLQNLSVRGTTFSAVFMLLMSFMLFSSFFTVVYTFNGVSSFVSGYETIIVGTESELRAAINGAGATKLITFSADITLTNTALTIMPGQNITLVTSAASPRVWKLIGASGQDVIIVKGTLTIDGVIVTHVSGQNGRGVIVNGGTLNLNLGEISGNTATVGGGVYVAEDGVFNLSGRGGVVANNTAQNGGGVYVATGGSFIMTGGKVADNTARDGGGVYAAVGGSVKLLGGRVSGNVASGNGGGVWVTNTNALADFEQLAVAAGVVFADNRASDAYTRNSIHDELYAKLIRATNWSSPFTQGYNNYDISYTYVSTPIVSEQNTPIVPLQSSDDADVVGSAWTFERIVPVVVVPTVIVIVVVEFFRRKQYLGKKRGHSKSSGTLTNNDANVDKEYTRDKSQFKTLSYTVKYYQNDAFWESVVVVEKKVLVNSPNVLTVVPLDKSRYDGYVLDHTMPVILPLTIADGSTIKAYYVKNADDDEPTKDNVVVLFDVNTGDRSVKPPLNITVTCDEPYGALPRLLGKRTRHIFLGWYTAVPSGERIISSTKVTNAKNHTLYAHWLENIHNNYVTITFNVNNNNDDSNVVEDLLDSLVVAFDAEYGLLPDLSNKREGYTFLGWFTKAKDGDKVTSSTRMRNTDDHTLYAHWLENNDNDNDDVVVSFDVNVADSIVETPPDMLVTCDESYGTLPSLTDKRPGYIFVGWYTAPPHSERVTESTRVRHTDDHTLYAHWIENTCNDYGTVLFDVVNRMRKK